MLAERRKELQTRIADLEAYVSYIDGKNELYRRILDGEIPYVSNLIEA